MPWSECSDEQRLDVHNGLLLSALWDAAFDARSGLIPYALRASPTAGLLDDWFDPWKHR